MKKSFKYIILILMISFLVATLCCQGHQLYEKYSSYPSFQTKEQTIINHNVDDLQELLFKYNNIISNPEQAGAYEIANMLYKQKQDKGASKDRERIIYKPLTSYPSLRYETILPPLFIDKEILYRKKHKEIVIDSDDYEKAVDGALEIVGEVTLDTKGVEERSKLGVVYYEENNCQGYWSDWNTDNCGEETNRCGIRFKKYEIVRPEIYNEKGQGKPCDFNDGDIKYKYCVGSQNDSNESNMERCDIPFNVCPCKLIPSNPPNADGETVYDLEDENCLYEMSIDCICPTGFTHISQSDICVLTPGEDCSLKEPGCIYNPPDENGVGERCSIPQFINQEAENNFYKNHPSSNNGKCKEKECVCENGTPVENERCLIDGLQSCDLSKPCNDGYYYSGNPPECLKQSEENNECSCIYGEPLIESASIRCSQAELDSHRYDILNNCERGSCPTGYEYIPNSQNARCDQHYTQGDGYENITCCLPKFKTCELNEPELEEKNIVRKELSGD